MKLCTTKILTAAVMSCFAGVALANQVTITNVSTTNPLHVTYKVFHQNQGQLPVMGSQSSASISGSKTIDRLNLDGYEYVGIIPLAVEGKILPAGVPLLCSVKTSGKQTEKTLTMNFNKLKDGHFELTCSSTPGE